jgi:hypothetical protein
VVANIERVAGRFVTKTVYAAIIAVAVGGGRDHLPVLPPAPDHHQHAHHRGARVLPGPGPGDAAGQARLHPAGPRIHHSGRAATAAAALASYFIARSAGYAAASRTAAMLAIFAMGLWVLALVAGRPTASRIALIAAMAAGLVPLFAVPVARRVLALQQPPAGILVGRGTGRHSRAHPVAASRPLR